MKKVAVTAGDILTPLGDIDSTWKAMCDGRTGLVSSSHPSVNQTYALGRIEGLKGRAGDWERLQSLMNNLLLSVPKLKKDTQLFVATTKGAIDELMDPGGKVEGQPWQLAGYLKEKLQLTGQAQTVSGACASGTLAIIQAAMRVSQNHCDHALVIGIDLIADFILAGFDSLKGLSSTGAKPFDRRRDGLSLGDGGGWLLLSSEEKLAHAKPLAWIDGWGIACDATHITAPCRKGSGLRRVFGQIMQPGISQLGGINAHGTGTVYNDAMELLVFKEKCAPGTPICSGKGAIGHSLGASGVIEAMLSIVSLQKMVLPPTIGLIDPEDTDLAISGEQQLPLRAPSILSTNSGFGGINAAVRFAAP